MNKDTYSLVLLIVLAAAVCFWAYNSSNIPEPGVVAPPMHKARATVATRAVVKNTSTAAAILAGTKDITWDTANYPINVGMDINLIRKISDSPRQFEFVRKIATNTPNDGKETWTPGAGEDADNLYVEVTCSSTHQFDEGCGFSSEPVKVN